MFAAPTASRKKGSIERHEADRADRDGPAARGGGYGQQRPGSQGGRYRAPARDVIRWRCHFRNTIYEVFKSKKGWKEMPRDEDGSYTDSMDWDICWSDRSWVAQNFDTMRLEEWQRVNHFRNNYELTRKDHMVKNLKRQRKQLEREGRLEEAENFDFFPTTCKYATGGGLPHAAAPPAALARPQRRADPRPPSAACCRRAWSHLSASIAADVVPQEYGLFYEEFKRNPTHTWIMKPVGRAQGKGIFLFTKLNQISDWKKNYKWRPTNGDDQQEEAVETYVAQRYIDNPYLIGGTKSDMRLYALVTSFSPLTVWVYRAGFARFSMSRFSMKKKDVANAGIHLTNVAVQKTAEGYSERTGGGADEDGGDDTTKMSLRQLKLLLAARHGMAAALAAFDDMELVIIRSLLAVQKIMINDKHCFELYGYDIMLDDTLKAWLIEVNSSPSLSASSDSDFELKFAMLEDTMHIVDLERKLQGTEVQVGGYDLVWCGGPVKGPKGAPNAGHSNLGSSNLRETNLRALSKAAMMSKR